MLPVKSSTRLAISIGLISVSVIWLAVGLKLIPDGIQPQIEGRIKLVESIAITSAALTECKRERELEAVLKEIDRRNDQVMSIGIRDVNGKLQFASGNHARLWDKDDLAAPDQMTIKIFENRKERGQLEIKFAALSRAGWGGFFAFPLPLIMFCGSLIILLNWSYLGRTLRQLNPARVVPDRVRSAFDTLTDGLLLIDPDCQIVMANQAFRRIVNQAGKDILGHNIDDFEWQFEDSHDQRGGGSPWRRCMGQMQTQRGDLITLKRSGMQHVRYAVGATPISGPEGKCRGALVSFHDVTALELKKDQMAKMLTELSASRDEVQRKNRDLQILASTDPLTGCLNRRSFFDRFQSLWEKTPGALSAIMVDIDHFKSINDKYGHATGDVVLQETGKMLAEFCGPAGLVGRYGGEEFAIVVTALDLNSAFALADKLRLQFINLKPGGLDVTMSIGLSSREQGAMDCQHLLDQADQSLYIAKREGRNRVVRWDKCRASQILIEEQAEANRQQSRNQEIDKTSIIHYPVVTAMLSALAFRDRETAVHSTRVAKLSVQVGRRLMNKDELYELEVAALLHDVGKIGVPDAILRKPGPLTPEEWTVMSWHNDIGIEIVRSAFASEKITEFIRYHHRRAGDAMSGALVDLEHVVPLGARVLTVCDAFDAMTNNRVYRHAISRDEALAELYRCSDQFDPLIVRSLERVLNEERLEEKPASPTVAASIPAPTPLELGAFVEHLSQAIASGNVEKLRDIARRVEATAAQHNIDSVVKAANRLEVSIDQNEASLNQLVVLADEIIDLCRSSRSQVVENPIVMRSEELITGGSSVADNASSTAAEPDQPAH